MYNDGLLMEAISCIDDIYIESYFSYKQKMGKRRKLLRGRRSAVIAAAASLVGVVVSLAMLFILSEELRPQGDDPDFPISLSEVTYTGQLIDAQESDAFFTEYENEILTILSRKLQKPVDSLHLIDKGIYHLNLTPQKNYINYDIITFFIVDDMGNIMASIDLIRDHNDFTYQLNYNGTRFRIFSEILNQQEDTDFVLVYIGAFTEALIAPDNTFYDHDGKIVKKGDEDFYSTFNKTINVINSTMLKPALKEE